MGMPTLPRLLGFDKYKGRTEWYYEKGSSHPLPNDICVQKQYGSISRGQCVKLIDFDWLTSVTYNQSTS